MAAFTSLMRQGGSDNQPEVARQAGGRPWTQTRFLCLERSFLPPCPLRLPRSPGGGPRRDEDSLTFLPPALGLVAHGQQGWLGPHSAQGACRSTHTCSLGWFPVLMAADLPP